MLVNKVYDILEEREIEYSEKFLRRAKTVLHLSGRKVFDSNNLLADKVTRVIAEKSIEERKQAKETINSIRNLAMKMIDKTSSLDSYITIEGDAMIDLPMEKKLGEENIIAEFDEQPKAAENVYDINALNRVVDTKHINRKELLNNIERLLNERSLVALSEVLKEYPVSKGLAEVLGYISLVPTTEKFYINEKET
jgi:hypothetical protein